MAKVLLDHGSLCLAGESKGALVTNNSAGAELLEAGSYSAPLPVVLSLDVDPLVDKMTLAGIQIGRASSYLIS